MDATHSPDAEAALASATEADVTPVRIGVADLSTTAPEYLRDLKVELAASGYQLASLETTVQSNDGTVMNGERSRLREVIRAGAHLGVSRVVVTVSSAARGAIPVDDLRRQARSEGLVLAVVEASA